VYKEFGRLRTVQCACAPKNPNTQANDFDAATLRPLGYECGS